MPFAERRANRWNVRNHKAMRTEFFGERWNGRSQLNNCLIVLCTWDVKKGRAGELVTGGETGEGMGKGREA